MKKFSRREIIISGGGTAGHLLPGLALAHALVEKEVANGSGEIHFVGSKRGIEKKLVPSAGFKLTQLSGDGIQRTFRFKNLVSICSIFLGLAQALFLILKRKPRIVISLGGFASVPCALIAVILRIPLLVMEQNAVPGLANRVFARFAKATVVTFEGTGLPKAVNLGNPVRESFISEATEKNREILRSRLGVDEGSFFLLIFGGSLGAQRINESTKELVESWDADSIVVHHVIGERDFNDERFKASIPTDLVDYRPVEYESNMPEVMAAADLVICRAGATTVAEISIVGVPSILIPLPNAPGDHQTANARALYACGGAVHLSNDELDGNRLKNEVMKILSAEKGLEDMAVAAKLQGRPRAASDIANLVEMYARD